MSKCHVISISVIITKLIRESAEEQECLQFPASAASACRFCKKDFRYHYRGISRSRYYRSRSITVYHVRMC